MKQLVGTGLITLTNISNAKIDVWYSPTPDIQFSIDNEKRLGDITTPSWHTPSKEGDIYMVQRIGGIEEPWGPVVRMEGIAGISYRMRGTWRPGVEYVGACEYENNNPNNPITPVILKGNIDLVIYQGSTFACIKTHTSDPVSIDQTPPNKDDVMEAQKIDPMPEVKTKYWVLTSMLGMQGPTGATGPTGPDGKPTVNLILSNENHSFTANAEGVIVTNERTTTEVQAYIGTEEAPKDKVVITYPTGEKVPPGLTLSWQVDQSTKKEFLQIVAANNALLADSGSFPITAKVTYGKDSNNKDLVTVVKKEFSWIKIRNAEAPYSVMVYSTKGNIFKKGTANTTLVATIMHGEQDVSVKMKDKVVWYKITPSQEIEWAKGVLEIDIDPSQVDGQAVFACEVEV